MKRLLLLATLICLAAVTSHAQDDLRVWDRWPITWDDFKTVDSSIGREHSYLEFLLDIEESPFDENGRILIEPELVAVAFMDKSQSWVDKNYRNSYELLYNQVLFDIVGLYRCKLQLAIDTNGYTDLDYHIQLLSHVVDSFCLSTDYGNDIAAVLVWKNRVEHSLDSIAPILVDKHGRQKHTREYVVMRAWEKGLLSWSNFSNVSESIGDEHSHLTFSLDIEDRRTSIGGIMWPVKTAVANMYRQYSWVDKRYRTPEQLRYNQVLFNLVELYRRHLQVVIDTLDKSKPDSVLTRMRDDYMRSLVWEAGHYCRSTRFGYDTAAVKWWEYDIRMRLDSITPLMVEKHAPSFVLPEYTLPWFIGLNTGGGFKYFGGELQPLFAPSGGVYTDLELGYSRHILTLGMYIGGGRCKLDTLFAVEDRNTLLGSDDILTMDLYANYGFAVVDSRHLRIMPFVGYGMQGLFYSDAINQVSGGPKEGCWRAGLDIKYHFSNEIYASRSIMEQYIGSLDAKVYVSRDKFNALVGVPRGYTINVALGFSLIYREGKARTHVN